MRRTIAFETVAVGALGLAAAAASLWVVPDLRGALGAGLAMLMVAIAAIDARHFIIPNMLNAGAFALALPHAVLAQPDLPAWMAMGIAVLRGAVLALLFLALRAGYLRLRGRDGIGLGDVKLAAVAGAWLDWPSMPIAVEIGALGALATYAFRHFAFGEPMGAASRIPFGLFLAPAIWFAWMLDALLIAF